MFKGCKQEDMPPHVFAAAQTSYRTMLASRMDQSLVMLGTSGSGKTTNAKHILHYLASATASQHSTITGMSNKLISLSVHKRLLSKNIPAMLESLAV